MTGHALATAAGGPVIPNFGGPKAFACERANRLFCWGWFSRNWDSVLWPALRQHVVLTVLDPVRSSGNMAVAFIHEHEEPAKAGEKPDDYRILYVFRKGPKGCRVTMELFTSGTF